MDSYSQPQPQPQPQLQPQLQPQMQTQTQTQTRSIGSLLRNILPVTVPLAVAVLWLLRVIPIQISSFLLGIVVSAYLTDSFLWDGLRYVLTLQSGIRDYKMDHIMLNMHCDEFWLNMGYWKDTVDFVKACEALAKLVAERAQIPANASVIDFGAGCGDQTLFFLKQYDILAMTTVTLEATQGRFAKNRIHEFLARSAEIKTRVQVLVGDATDPQSWQAVDSLFFPVKSMRPRSAQADIAREAFDVALSLDAQYHFDDRKRFFSLVHSLLKPGGAFSCTDIVRAAHRPRSFIERLLLNMFYVGSSVPESNRQASASDVVAMLEDAGFVDIDVLDVSEHVFPGLARFFDCQENRFGTFMRPMKWRPYRIVSWLLRWVSRDEMLKFIAITARKSGSST
ncbi:S-adenosyl-L-methionine-dependent methyltransferase [Polychytrium aggregatum]|uniref:S-adenosyl-L-methionine-dependent methyltransferase n=1 Tax=Polychytrium aggregatum TaxID=110093 RepID=UPI0022FE6C59|nr:S-adenosyl-L-methionine-dependent methyltransferase [Polychytrium aggregatum]KAI9204026.1 S-adenosyl-L-methionine-dependent methyltransferase [Polychytrium aggregatum]